MAAGGGAEALPGPSRETFPGRATNEHHAEQAAKDAHSKKALDSINAFQGSRAGCRSPSTPSTASWSSAGA
jgi:hypothetical protein